MPHQVICWFSNIQPDKRTSSNLSDGAVFANLETARKFAASVRAQGGAVLDIIEQPNAVGYWETVREYYQPHTSAELAEIAQRRQSIV
jgi:hypothetical protein